jgi:Methyltransferase domain
LDLGTRDKRLIRLIKANWPDIEEAVALDVSPTMLEFARDHFAGDSRVKIVKHDLSQPLPDLGYFDAVANRLLPIEIQLGWLRDIGFVEVDCYWKWLEMPLLIGYKA